MNWYPADPSSALAKNLPLFKCRTFEVLREREGLSVVINLRFGAYRGHVLEFRVIQINCTLQLTNLTNSTVQRECWFVTRPRFC